LEEVAILPVEGGEEDEKEKFLKKLLKYAPREKWLRVPASFRTSVASRLMVERREEAIRKEESRAEEEKKARDGAVEKALARPMRKLTAEEKGKARSALYGGGPEHEIVASIEMDSVTRKSLRTLRPNLWLNDEVIHYFLVTLSKRDAASKKRRSHFFKSFFVTKLLDEGGEYRYRNVKRWSKKVPGKDIFALEKIIIPINLGNMHWCTAVIFIQLKKIQYYDSMGGSGRRILEGLFRYLKDEMRDKKKVDGNWEDWKLVECQPDTPQQTNGVDCGVFSCAFADYLSRDRPLTFTQKNIPEYRERLVLSILNGKALD